jgi:hypothetical protein
MIRIAVAVLLVTLSAATTAETAVVALDYGITKIDLTGKGDDAMVVLARRENFNAHGFDVASIYVRTSTTPGAAAVWNIVPVFRDRKERRELTAGGGTDCLLHDFRLLHADTGTALTLVVADRPRGNGYGEKSTVTFERYALKKNADGSPGWPVYYFERTSSSTSKRAHCDVGEALEQELRLGAYMARR